MSRLYSTVFSAIIAISIAVGAESAFGSVILPHTRVIYDASAPERTLQFTNPDGTPSLMQVWIDAGDPQSTPKTANAPFVVTPPIFRIEPKAGQTVRIAFTGKDLPQDRESLFYLNTLQVPSVNASQADRNQMTVMLHNRLKLFYRPSAIEGSAQNAHEKLSFRIGGKHAVEHIAADNASGFYVSLVAGRLTCGAHEAAFEPEMLAPRSGMEWRVKGNCPLDGTAIRVTVRYVDDYGAVRDADYPATVSDGK
jgi:fimbrial chaperone protein